MKSLDRWVVSPSFPDYEVSEVGGVRRCIAARGSVVGKILKPWLRDDGYNMFILRRDGRSYHRKAHQLVVEAFHRPKPFAGAEVRHLDGSRDNDHWSNLRWGTSSENKADMLLHGTRQMGERHSNAKLTWASVRQIRKLVSSGAIQRIVGQAFGISQTQVSCICNGKRWRQAA